jgi:hypothetical protein
MDKLEEPPNYYSYYISQEKIKNPNNQMKYEVPNNQMKYESYPLTNEVPNNQMKYEGYPLANEVPNNQMKYENCPLANEVVNNQMKYENLSKEENKNKEANIKKYEPFINGNNNQEDYYQIVEPDYNNIYYKESNNILIEIKSKWDKENYDIILKYKTLQDRAQNEFEYKTSQLQKEHAKFTSNIENMKQTEINSLNKKRNVLIQNVLSKSSYNFNISVWDYVVKFFKNL